MMFPFHRTQLPSAPQMLRGPRVPRLHAATVSGVPVLLLPGFRGVIVFHVVVLISGRPPLP